jgi:hypothetical protein
MLTDIGVFSGAGLSHAEPAGLPLGNGLRDLVLDLCHAGAQAIAPAQVAAADLAALHASAVKLEVVLGRLHGVIGDSALGCLHALRLQMPNTGHLLAGLHLLHGGSHVTVNFDEGIELAVDLLIGTRALPAAADPSFGRSLAAWQGLVPAHPVTPVVAATELEFRDWLARGTPAALLKIHGSVRASGTSMALAEPVVLDEPELAQLSQAKRAALAQICRPLTTVVSGYSGQDIDVYRPLLQAAARTRLVWAAPTVLAEVRTDLGAHGSADIRDGPDGYADIALARAFGMSSVPAWPSTPATAGTFTDRLIPWLSLMATQPPGAFAEAYAWLLADSGRLDEAVAILSAITSQAGRRAEPRLLNRLADAEYDRNQPGDKKRARRRWLRMALRPDTTALLRAYALTRAGESFRGEALSATSRFQQLLALTGAAALPALAVGLCLGGRRNPNEAARAMSALSGLALRVTESIPPRTSPRRHVGRLIAAAGARTGNRALRLQPTGSRMLFLRQQSSELAAYLALLAGRAPAADTLATVREIQHVYRAAGDPRGIANATAALAVVAMAAGDRLVAAALLDDAEQLYADSRPGQVPDPAGVALVRSRRKYLAALP